MANLVWLKKGDSFKLFITMPVRSSKLQSEDYKGIEVDVIRKPKKVAQIVKVNVSTIDNFGRKSTWMCGTWLQYCKVVG